jgi:diguanylate cyclase (GGDEF)-like protein
MRACLAALWLLAGAGSAGPALAQAPAAANLERIEALAGRQPDEARKQLDDWRKAHPAPDAEASRLADLIEIRIADAQYRAPEVLQRCEAVERSLHGAAEPRVRAVLAQMRANANYELGRFDAMKEALEQERQQAELAKDDDLEAMAIVNWTRYYMKQGDYQSAARALAEAAPLARSAATRAELTFSNTLFSKSIGDWGQAASSARQAMAAFQELSDRTGVADSLEELGNAQLRVGRPEEAAGSLQEAARIYAGLGDEDGEATAALELAQAQAALGEQKSALERAHEAVRRLARLDAPVKLASARVDLARLLLQSGSRLEAAAELRRAQPTVLAVDDPGLRERFHETYARCLLGLGEVREAYGQMQLSREQGVRRAEQLVERQLAAQRGRIEFEQLLRENDALKASYSSSQDALEAARRASRYQSLALVLGAVLIAGTAVALWCQRVLVRQLAKAARTDALTGVLNRRAFLEACERTIARCVRTQSPCAMLMLDADHFKDVNDTLGHAEGDHALQEICSALNTILRPADLVGRLGGEEFAVLLPGVDAQRAAAIAERVRVAVEARSIGPKPGRTLTVSVGAVAEACNRPVALDFLLKCADKALYEAKSLGRNRVQFA